MQDGAAFQERLARALRPYPVPGRYLIGVSGGRDSVLLWRALWELGYRGLTAVHLDHGLRGAASRADARFVARLGKELGAPVEIGRVDVAALAASKGVSIETAARDARLAFFAEVSARRRCRTVFLAHHADDQVETFLFRLLRGSGPAGLGAMRAESRYRAGRRQLLLVRPLLGLWREEIDAYVKERGWKWREDATNADPAHATRNRLRLEALPALTAAMGRDVRSALWRAAEVLGAEDEFLASMLEAGPPLPARLPLARLLGQQAAWQRRLLRAWLAARGASGIGFEEIERVRAMLQPGAGAPAKINLPGNRHVRRRAGVLFIERSPG
jgi:tRNA(Ile)-lysidine synthase